MKTLMPGPFMDSPQRTRRTQRTKTDSPQRAQRPQRNARGVTLVELLVVLLLLGVIAGVSGLALTALHREEMSSWSQMASRARREAIISGRPVVAVDSAVPEHAALFLPDGRAIGPGVDPLTGEVMRETP